jgi:IS5 family transposase
MQARWPKPLVAEGIQAIVLRTICPNQTLWDAILPEQCLGLPPGLAEVDRLLDDPRFFEPFRPFFHPTRGRPSIPMETFLRIMFLRFRYKLGYEALCREIADSLAWRRFCRIPLGEPVPHPSTIEKIATRCGTRAIDQLNEALLAKAHECKVIKLDKARADSTVIQANVSYPTDSGLLAKGVAKMAAAAKNLKHLGLAARTTTRDRTRSVRRRAHAVAAWLRRRNDEAKDEVLAITGELADIAELAVAEARAVAGNARRTLARRGAMLSGKARALVADLDRTANLVEQIVAQTRLRLSGDVPDGATRVVSLHDADARPIRKGRLGIPVEFGYKAQVVDNADGVVIDHVVVKGNPPDAPMLRPAIERIKTRFGKAPKAVTADRGYGEAKVDAELDALGVKQVAIPRRGRPGAARQHIQRSRWFSKLVKWRTGSEGRISSLKRDWQWARTLMDGEPGAQAWCGWGVLASNSIKISALITTTNEPSDRTPRPQPCRPAGSGPPHGPPVSPAAA